MPTSLILYGARNKLSTYHKTVHHSIKQPRYYVRIEAIDCTPEEALSLARPRDGETVLNTVEIKEEGE